MLEDYLVRIKGPNICFDCANAYGGCPWTEEDPETGKTRFAPVPGWTAERSVMRNRYRHKGKRYVSYIETYHITACPMFVEEKVAEWRKEPEVIMTTPRACKWCGKPYTGRSKLSLYCSEACNTAAKYARAKKKTTGG